MSLPTIETIAVPTPETRRKLADLERILQGYGSLIVAYSGGVDSAFLAVVAARVLNEKALAVTADSESLAPEELDENYASNPLNRCYFCQTELMKKLLKFAEERGGPVALGATMDDLSDIRPGESAAKERGAVFPLRDAKLFKEEIRSLSHEMNLPTWDKPGAACLSSRIPFGERVSAEKLSHIARGEYYLHKAGFRECRLRHHGTIARLEIPPEKFADVLEKSADIARELKALGFAHVTLDLQGLRSGSLMEAALKK
jgi:uncharacterized protein